MEYQPEQKQTHPLSSWKNKVAIGAVFVVLSIASFALYNGIFGNRAQKEGVTRYPAPFYGCNVLGLNVHGDIYTYIPPESLSGDGENSVVTEDIIASEDIVASLEEAEHDPRVKAILLDIDSAGGLPVAAEEIATALKRITKPTVSVIRQSGLSAAYWVATATDKIYASRNSDVGSIGVTMSYLRNYVEPGQYVELTSGKFKDTGNPDKGITAEERALLLRDVEITHKNFIEAVALNRNLSIEKVTAIADGSSVLGDKAKEIGLIDAIGSWQEAKEYLTNRINETVEICWQ